MTSEHKFEEIVRKILVIKGFRLTQNTILADRGFDFIAQLHDDYWAVEVKFYRTARPQLGLLEAAALRLTSRAPEYQAKKGMLAVSCLVPPDLLMRLTDKFSIKVVDRVELLSWAAESPDLLDELSSLLEATATELSTPPIGRTQLEGPNTPYLEAPRAPEDSKGTNLCTELKQLPSGAKKWAAYEALCERILKYLFPYDLQGWHKQNNTEDRLSRFDYVCRIRPTTEFWQFLSQHLGSRYIVFEFKNYSESIKQGQILTTEKYLLERGLRRVAIIFTRLGAHQSATRMARGAMREHGKLILVFNDADICKMLHMRERGEDPSDHLFNSADNFLLSLAR